MPSHFDPELGISLEAPAGWERGRTGDFPLLMLAPRESDYRSNLGFSRADEPAPDAQLMEQTIAASRAQQREEYPSFVELGEQRFEIDGCRAFVQTYRWQPPSAPQPFVQVFGVVLTPAHGLVELNGATLQSLAERTLPIFDRILASIRFIPR